MTNRCSILFNPADIIALLVEATGGLIPPDARLLEVWQHPHLDRIIAFLVESSAWTTPHQIQLRFDEDGQILVYDGSIEPVWQPTDPSLAGKH